ncbi:GNAT family N-acetyltransferase [Glycomyces sp. NPDC046736]|uniref:GNAT family N-acetyltransferase n=1 Tax=Glycomyces sp. NPDC046736 TaxID=3155615 RepID=UPI0033C907B3
MNASSPFLIRTILPAEHAALGDLTVEAYHRGGMLLGGLDDPYAPRLRDVAHRAASAHVLVAVEAGPGTAVLGGVTLAFAGSAMAELAGPGESEIRMLAVAPDAQGRGVGMALVAECVERSRAQGVKRMVLCSQREMRGAHRIYGRFGFQRAPELDWEPVPEVPLWGFELDLG